MFFDLDTPQISEREFGKFTIRCHDPYGFFKISKTGGGAIPKVLDGAYTTLTEAQKAIETYERQIADLAKETAVKPTKKKE